MIVTVTRFKGACASAMFTSRVIEMAVSKYAGNTQLTWGFDYNFTNCNFNINLEFQSNSLFLPLWQGWQTTLFSFVIFNSFLFLNEIMVGEFILKFPYESDRSLWTRHSFSASRCLAIRRQKLLFSPWFGVVKNWFSHTSASPEEFSLFFHWQRYNFYKPL